MLQNKYFFCSFLGKVKNGKLLTPYKVCQSGLSHAISVDKMIMKCVEEGLGRKFGQEKSSLFFISL